MEVHHHVHPPEGGTDSSRKKWSHYFWEFLMLFLAVFCGFLAENIREHQVEHHREKQYMSSMLQDLKSDTSLLSAALRYWDEINEATDSVASAIGFPYSFQDEVTLYQYYNKAIDYYSFVYNDRTLSQLKNSGGFRLICKEKVATKLILFDQFNNDAIKNIAELHESFYKTVMQLANKVINQDLVNRLFNKSDSEGNWVSKREEVDSLLRASKFNIPGKENGLLLFEFKNALLAYRKDYSNMKWGYDHLKVKMEELIGLIKKEYNLE